MPAGYGVSRQRFSIQMGLRQASNRATIARLGRMIEAVKMKAEESATEPNSLKDGIGDILSWITQICGLDTRRRRRV
jgi:hypothetical protein